MAKKKAPKRKGVPRTPPYQHYPEWTQARFFGFLRSALRSGYNKWPPKWQVLKAAQRAYEGNDKRCKWEYLCAECNQWHKAKDVSVDHIIPAGSLNCFDDVAGFVERLFCGPDGLQVLCRECHNAKTAAERKEKADARRDN
jgi:5-methylcytosine-specific restriction endonuclease McrA